MATCRAFLQLSGCHVYGEIQICSHVSVKIYKQSRFSLKEKNKTKQKTSWKLQAWPDLFLREVLNQELAHQPLCFACLLDGPRWPYDQRCLHITSPEGLLPLERITVLVQQNWGEASEWDVLPHPAFTGDLHEPPWGQPGGFIISFPVGMSLGAFRSLASFPGSLT